MDIPKKIKTKQLFRAVKPAELEQIKQTRTFQLSKQSVEGKYFSSKEGASQYARQAYRAFATIDGYEPYTIVKTSISEEHIDDSWKVVVDSGIETIVVPSTDLPKLATPKILNFCPLLLITSRSKQPKR